MQTLGQRPESVYSGSPIRRSASFVLLTLALGFVGALCARGSYREAAVVAAISAGVAFFLVVQISIESVLLVWFVTTPMASFLIRFPTDRSVITFNRVVFGLLLIMLLESHRVFTVAERVSISQLGQAHFSLSRFEISWALLSLLALASTAALSNNVGYALRIAVDTFWLPLFAFYFARRHFDLRTSGRSLLAGCMALALFLFATGAIELATGVDLFQYKGAELVREGERRVNGPFAADSSFAIICLILFLFLKAAPRIISVRFDRGGRLFYVCATGAAALGTLLPLFRVAVFALILCWVAQRWLSRRNDLLVLKRSEFRRLARVAGAAAVISIVLLGWLAIALPERSALRLLSPRTVFGRLATWQGAAEIAAENPLIGV